MPINRHEPGPAHRRGPLNRPIQTTRSRRNLQRAVLKQDDGPALGRIMQGIWSRGTLASACRVAVPIRSGSCEACPTTVQVYTEKSVYAKTSRTAEAVTGWCVPRRLGCGPEQGRPKRVDSHARPRRDVLGHKGQGVLQLVSLYLASGSLDLRLDIAGRAPLFFQDLDKSKPPISPPL